MALFIGALIAIFIPRFSWQVFAVAVSTGILGLIGRARGIETARELGITPRSDEQYLLIYLGIAVVMLVMCGIAQGVRALIRRKDAVADTHAKSSGE